MMKNLGAMMKNKVLSYLIIAVVVSGAAKLLAGVAKSLLGKIPLIGKVLGSIISMPLDLIGKLFIPLLIVLAVYFLFQIVKKFLQRKKAKQKAGIYAGNSSVGVGARAGKNTDIAVPDSAVQTMSSADPDRIDSFD